ncbi:hypothetical protein AB0K80_06910 [Streptomyces sp. NPDC052682]|uniref:hypothetical protein n=1 Tax=Streptomyces sp. NPDC052682 TaxID=3154954 RepID=UPI00343094E3
MAASVILVGWAASPASAGGPTSVLVVSPASEETASLYNGDEQYTQLERLLGPLGGTAGTRTKPPEAVLEASRHINVTWMVHDVTPWRVDQVYVGSGSGGPVWIHTTTEPTRSFDGPWHRARHPAPLRQLLRELGVMGETSPEGSSGVAPVPAARDLDPSATTEPAAAASSTRAARTNDSTDWWWALPGAAAGAVMALALRPFAPRIRPHRLRRKAGPRQELLDL